MTEIVPHFLIHIADMAFSVRGASMAQLKVPEHFASFASPIDEVVLSTDVEWREGDPLSLSVGEPVFDPGSIWQVFRRPDAAGWAVRVGYPDGEADPEVQAALHANADWSRVSIIERLPPSGSSLLGIGVGELLLRARIPHADGMVFHAAGIDDNGWCIMFVGHAGAGKSTQATMWRNEPGVVAMNDDRIAVRLTPAGPIAYGAPWGGTAEIAINHRVPLRAVVVLEQAPENAVIPLAPADAAPRLVPRLFLPYWDEALMTRVLASMNALLERIPVYLLRCRPEPDVIAMVRAAI